MTQEIEPSRGLSHGEIQERFAHKFPMLSTVNLSRRTRELCEQKKLWRKDDPDGTARFYLYLKLREIEKVGQEGDDRKNQHDSRTNLNNSDVEKSLGELVFECSGFRPDEKG